MNSQSRSTRRMKQSSKVIVRRWAFRRPVHELLEARHLLTASGFPGNDCPPDLDLTSVPAQAATVGSPLTFNLFDLGATVEDLDAGGSPTGDAIRVVLDPDVGSDTPVGAEIQPNGDFSWTPTSGQEGLHNIVVIAIDEGMPPLADAEVLVVDVRGSQAPIVDLNGSADGNDASGFEFTEDQGPVDVANLATISDEDSAILTSATISLVDTPDGIAELLAVDTSSSPISAEYDNQTGILSLSGDASVAEYQQVLRTLSYENSSQDPTAGARTINVLVTDDNSNVSILRTTSLTVNPVNDMPVLAAIEDQTTALDVQLEITVTATDPDNSVLSFELDRDAPGANIPDSATITPNADGLSAVIRYTPTASDSSGPFTFVVTVSDNDPENSLDDSESFTVSIVGSEPVVDLNGSAPGQGFATNYEEDSPAVAIVDPALTIEDADSDGLTSARVTITNLQDIGAEEITVDTSDTGILSEYDANTGVLSLDGVASLNSYQQVLRTLQYRNSSQDPVEGDRVISIVVSDGATSSTPVEATVSVMAVNDVPDLMLPAPHSNPNTPAFGQIGAELTFTAAVDDPDHNNSELFFFFDLEDSGISPGSTLPTITSAPNDPVGGLFSWTPDEAGTFTITLIVTDAEGGVDQETFIVEVVAPSATWINPDGGLWNVAENWQGGVVPDADDFVFIGDLNDGARVTVNSFEEVAGILLDGDLRITSGELTSGTLNVRDGEFSITSGTLRDTALNTQVSDVVALAGGTLNNVTLNGDAVIEASTSNRTVTVINGLELNGNLSLAAGPGRFATLNFSGTQELGGSGRVIFSNENLPDIFSRNSLNFSNADPSASETLTLGAGIEVVGESGAITTANSAQDGIAIESPIVGVDGGTLSVAGVTGALSVDDPFNSVLLSGVVNGLTIDGTSQTQLDLRNVTTFDNVTLNTDVVIDASTANQAVTVMNGLVLNGDLSIAAGPGRFATLNFSGSQELSGSGRVLFSDQNSPDLISRNTLNFANADPAGSETLTIGSGVDLIGESGSITIADSTGDSIVIQGAVEGVDGGALSIAGVTGTLAVDDLFGSVLLSGSLSDLTVEGTAGTQVGVSSGVTLTNTVINAGILLSSSTLDNVTLNGDAVIDASTVNQTVAVVNGLGLNGDLSLAAGPGRFATLNFTGTQVLSGSGRLVFSNQNSPDSSIRNSLNFANANPSASETLTIGLGIDLVGESGAITIADTAGDSIVIQGTVEGVDGGSLSIAGVTSSLMVDDPFGSVLLSGVLNGLTIDGTSQTELDLRSVTTLDNVTLNTNAVIDASTSSQAVTVLNGLELNGDLTLAAGAGRNARLDFSGTQEVSGTGRIVFSNRNLPDVSSRNTLNFVNSGPSDSEMLRLGAGIELVGESGAVTVADPMNDGILVQGEVQGVSGGSLSLGTGIGGTLSINDPFTSVSLTGSFIDLTVNGVAGTQIGLQSGVNLSNVTLNTNAVINASRSSQTVTVLNGLELNGDLTLAGGAGRNARLDFSGTQQLTGAGRVVFSDQNSPDVPSRNTLNFIDADNSQIETLSIGAGIELVGERGTVTVSNPPQDNIEVLGTTVQGVSGGSLSIANLIGGLTVNDTFTSVSLAGRIVDLTVNGTTGTQVNLLSGTSLDNVILNSDAVIDASASSQTVAVLNGLELNGDLTLAGGSGRNARLDFSGTQELSGTGRLVFSDQNSPDVPSRNTLNFTNSDPTGSETLTIRLGIELVGESGTVTVANSSQDNIVLEGTITVVQGGDLSISSLENDGLISVAGTLNAASIENRGLVSITSAGLASLTGDYTQTASGSLRFGIAGLNANQIGRLSTSGAVNAAGALEIVHENGFEPAVDDVFELIGFGSLSGDFDAIDAPDGTTYEAISDSDSFEVRVTGVTASAAADSAFESF